MNNKKYSTPRRSIPEGIKMEIRIEARHSCSICGVTSPLEFHHIDENRENNSLENIILLCCNHHREFHKGNITSRELIKYKKRLTENFTKEHELNFYLKKISWLTDNLFLDQWENINYMIGEEHKIDNVIKDKFEIVADNIRRTNFPEGIHQSINNIFYNLGNSLNEVVKVFMNNPHIEYDNICKMYFLSRRWKGKCQYTQEEYDRLNQIDVNFEIDLYDSYKNLCENIIKLQEYIWEKLDFDYLDRVKIQATFIRYFSLQENL